MIKFKITQKTSIEINESTEGESIEMKVERITTQKQPIEDSAPIIYTERKQGVLPSTDVRTDRFEVAIVAMDNVSKTIRARRDQAAGGDKKSEASVVEMKEVSKAEPIQATGTESPKN